MSDLKYIAIEVAKPKGLFPGQIEEAYFVVEDGEVQLYDMSQTSMGPKHRQQIPPHLTVREKAALMLRALVGSRKSDSDRRLDYPKLGY